MPRQQITLENIAAKGETAHYEQVLILSQCFQLDLKIILLFIEIFPLAEVLSKSSAADLLYVEKRLKTTWFYTFTDTDNS